MGYRMRLLDPLSHLDSQDRFIFGSNLIFATTTEGPVKLYGVFYTTAGVFHSHADRPPIWGVTDRSPKRVTGPDITATILMLNSSAQNYRRKSR